MCEANVYLQDGDSTAKLIFEAVNKVVPQDDGVYLENIFGDRLTLPVKILSMELIKHRITVTNL